MNLSYACWKMNLTEDESSCFFLKSLEGNSHNYIFGKPIHSYQLLSTVNNKLILG